MSDEPIRDKSRSREEEVPVEALGLDVTYRCPARCAHCAYACGPEGRYMEVAEAQALLRDGRDLGASVVCISGGEPFVDLGRLARIIQACRGAGFEEIWVFTNGFWARSRPKARVTVEHLRDLGVTKLFVSADSLHAPYVPTADVILLAGTAASVGLEVKVDCRINPLAANSDSETIQIAEQMRQIPGVQVQISLPWAIGRASSLFESVGVDQHTPEPTTGFSAGTAELRGPCNEIWPGGDLRVPGGVDVDTEGYVNLCPGLAIGKIGDRSLREVVGNYDWEAHPVVRVLADLGPVGLAMQAVARGYRPRSRYASRCHLCYDVRKFLRPAFPEYLGPANCYPEI
ncbi:radical SAM protein [Candidatus Bipolaricaulota bacterium]|nr:radical SAM protein [Candidatus Bipolaricaulota bacterium]